MISDCLNEEVWRKVWRDGNMNGGGGRKVWMRMRAGGRIEFGMKKLLVYDSVGCCCCCVISMLVVMMMEWMAMQ